MFVDRKEVPGVVCPYMINNMYRNTDNWDESLQILNYDVLLEDRFEEANAAHASVLSIYSLLFWAVSGMNKFCLGYSRYNLLGEGPT